MNLAVLNTIKIRSITVADAEKWLKLLIALEKESDFLMYEAGERDVHIEKCRKHIDLMTTGKTMSKIYVAHTDNDELVGHVSGEVFPMKKRAHTMVVSIGVLKQYKGIGRNLLQSLVDYSKQIKIRRLECFIMQDNVQSLNLAKKFGFKIEGQKKSAIKRGNDYIDEYILGCINE